ncbi:MAG: hypothetical protein M1376_10555 [Planctomycetes bacterium]|nr:hypothetical protein [Planctomycetota bacterium]
MLEDEWLKWKFRRGSRTALARIYEKYLDPMLTLAVGLLNNTAEAEDSEIYCEGQLITIHYWLPRQKVAYSIRPDRKQYWRTDYSDEQVAQGGLTDDPRSWLRKILSGEYTKLGRSTINGVAAEGVECKLPKVAGAESVMRLRVEVETNLPVRIEMERVGMEEGQMRPLKYVMENFAWDAQLDENLFEPNIPADYTPRPREEL